MNMYDDYNKYIIEDKSSPYYDKVQEYHKIVYYKMFDDNK